MAISPPHATPAMRPQTMAWSSFGRRRTHQFQTRTLSARPLRNFEHRAFWIGDFDTNCVRRLGPSDTEEDALISFEQTLTDWFMLAEKYKFEPTWSIAEHCRLFL